MLDVDVARSLGVVGLHVLDEFVGAFQVEPALVFAAELECTLVEDGLDGDGAADGVVLALDGASLAQRIDGGQSVAASLHLGLGLDEVHLGETEHHDVAIGGIVGGIGLVVDVVEEFLDAGI